MLERRMYINRTGDPLVRRGELRSKKDRRIGLLPAVESNDAVELVNLGRERAFREETSHEDVTEEQTERRRPNVVDITV